MFIFAFNIRYFRITPLTELTEHMIWTYPNKLLNQKKSLDRIQNLSACGLKS